MVDSAAKPLSGHHNKPLMYFFLLVAVLTFVTCLAGLVAALIPEPSPNRSLRKQLTQLESQNGWSLVTVNGDKLQEIQIADRSLRVISRLPAYSAHYSSISSDGKWIAIDTCAFSEPSSPTAVPWPCHSGFTHLAVVASDGTGFHAYPNLMFPAAMCWSPDDSKLVVYVQDYAATPFPSLKILDVKTGSTTVIDDGFAFVSEQCWSPDGEHVVYMVNRVQIQAVRIYDVAKGKSRDVASGRFASWSPDGKRIAFAYCPPSGWDCSYKSANPDGSQQILLFKIETSNSPLWWSPDSKFVAYLSWRTFREHSFSERLRDLAPVEQLDRDDRLRIRRLEDNSEDWLLNIGNSDSTSFQWIRRTPGTN